jgi:hypothetical protein
VPADAAGTLGGSSSAGAATGRSARPIAKQQANTAAPASTDTSTTRMWAPALPDPTSIGAVGIRKVFMTDTLSGWFPPGSSTHRPATEICRGGS